MKVTVDIAIGYCDVCLVAIASGEATLASDLRAHYEEEHPAALAAYFEGDS